MLGLKLLLFLTIAHEIGCDQFLAHDCTEPDGLEFVPHHRCRMGSDTLIHQTRDILQETTVAAIEGYECFGSVTTIISFCGAYSHNKETAESTYNVPMSISPQLCKQMIMSKSFVSEDMSFPLNMNSITAFNLFSHGSISRE